MHKTKDEGLRNLSLDCLLSGQRGGRVQMIIRAFLVCQSAQIVNVTKYSRFKTKKLIHKQMRSLGWELLLSLVHL